jgi:pSer/pThr/pTyr-binding forkhead associated (FHA) protein
MPASLLIIVVAISLAIAIVLWMRQSRRRNDPGARPPAATTTLPQATTAPTPTNEASFNPDATQMYMRPAKISATLNGNREGTIVSGARLVCLSGSQKGQSFALNEAGLIVGRKPSSDIVLSDSRVSGRHAWVGIVGGKALLRDLDSSNGTFLNTGTRAEGNTELCNNDTIFFGGHQGDQFRFVAE